MKRSYRGDRSMAMKKISCIIPCYNEEAALPYFLREIRKVADQMSATDSVLFEILFVNDGSKDRTLEILREAAKEDARVRYISFSRNFGKEAAMYAGFKNVTGDYAAVMDADMQDPPSLLPEMYRALQSGEYDSVATCRADRKGEPPIRSFFARCFYKIINQISGIDCVSFYVDEKPLTDVNGKMVGTMYAESFVENPGEQINSIQNTNLTLYFSNQAGDGLVKETRRVHYSSNISLEKLIMEQLLEGPESKNARSAIPSETKLMSVSLVDGVCYVSFDENFKNQDYSVNEAIVIYSIVDSLSELSSISKVQISVNGDTSGVYRDSFKLADMYDRNLDYIAKTTESDTEVVEETETEEQ